MVDYGLTHNIEDWHMAKVVLIPKANKPRYDIVKSWWMIHLLPTWAKVVERYILIRIAEEIELEPTQFGSRRKHGVHNAIATVYEFLGHNTGMKCAMVSMDVESRFDKADIDNLCNLMSAKGCSAIYGSWVRKWAGCRRVRFRFNGLVSRVFQDSLSIPQGFPLSPPLFGAYIADIFIPRLRYGSSIRRIVVSYIDDAVILIAADGMESAVNCLVETF